MDERSCLDFFNRNVICEKNSILKNNMSFFAAILHFQFEDRFPACGQPGISITSIFLCEEISQMSLFKKSLNNFKKKNDHMPDMSYLNGRPAMLPKSIKNLRRSGTLIRVSLSFSAEACSIVRNRTR